MTRTCLRAARSSTPPSCDECVLACLFARMQRLPHSAAAWAKTTRHAFEPLRVGEGYQFARLSPWKSWRRMTCSWPGMLPD